MAGKLEVGEGSGVERMECSRQKNREGENTGREIEGRKKIEEVEKKKMIRLQSGKKKEQEYEEQREWKQVKR